MVFLVSNTFCSTADIITKIFLDRGIPIFRYNTDEYLKYLFSWKDDCFEMEDPCGRKIKSEDITAVAFYKALISPNDHHSFDEELSDNLFFVKNTLNYITNALSIWAMENELLRLWPLREFRYPKTRQMSCAKRFFNVPKPEIHWGYLHSRDMRMFKTLTPFVTNENQYSYVDKCYLDELNPNYPWFTQEIAKGDRDATVLYINGKIHCYQFSTVRGERTDWRITQGTKLNRWERWNAGTDFKNKVDLYMKMLGLKFGRLDFIIGGKEPEFLEVNPCGQFGWLDDKKLTLVNEVVDAILDPATTIRL